MLVSLFPVARPRDQHSVVFQASQSAGLEQVGGGVTQIRRHGHLTEALHLLSLHQFMQCLERCDGEDNSYQGTFLKVPVTVKNDVEISFVLRI